jgi:hypothetical protein
LEKGDGLASGEPLQFTTSLTPAGIEIYYQWSPKRLYRLRRAQEHSVGFPGDPPVTYRLGLTEWLEVPSVTKVLECLNKPSLPWWGMTVGVGGVARLAAEQSPTPLYVVGTKDNFNIEATAERWVQRLIREKLTVNHVLSNAGDRGHSAHRALEAWAYYGTHPRPELFPEEERGYIEALLLFLQDCGETVRPLVNERMVGSLSWQYAGRYDIEVEILEPTKFVKHYTPKRPPRYETWEPGTYLLDLKSGKDVYPLTHFRQLEAYEHARIECGYEPTRGRGVIHVSAEGKYKLVVSTASVTDFFNVRFVHRDNEGIERRAREWRK